LGKEARGQVFRSDHRETAENDGRLGNGGNQDVRLFVSKRSIKQVSIARTRASLSFPGRTRSIETKPLATALEWRATGVIEKLGPLLTLTLAVSFGRVQKHRETCTVKLFSCSINSRRRWADQFEASSKNAASQATNPSSTQ
jgi:hypothetical protein